MEYGHFVCCLMAFFFRVLFFCPPTCAVCMLARRTTPLVAMCGVYAIAWLYVLAVTVNVRHMQSVQ